jgi:DNA-binding NarL/FixJ family response regulator
MPPKAATPRPLSPREVDVIRAIAEGLSTAEAAAHLDLSPDTLQGTLRVVFIKLGLRNRAQLVRWAFLNGLAKPAVGGLSQ